MTDKELSADVVDKAIDDAFKHLSNGLHNAYSTIGELLLMMKGKGPNGKRYKELGYETFDHYLASRKESRSVCYACMDYREWIVPLLSEHPKLESLPVTEIVRDIVPMLKKDKGCADRIGELSVLSDKDRKDEIRKLKGKGGQLECEHEWVAFLHCPRCKKFMPNQGDMK